MIASCTLLGMLGICSYEDIKQKEIHCMTVLIFGVAGILLHLYQREISIYSLLFGVLVGIAIMFFSALSGGMIGMGDGLVLSVTGIYLGGSKNTELLIIGLLLAAVVSLVLVVFKKRTRKDTIPFIPYLLAAYMGMLIL